MENKIVERILNDNKMLSKKERQIVIKNGKLISKVYIISIIDTYKTLKDV